MRALVIYHSFEGNTELLAKEIADEVGADLEELLPEKDPPSKGPMKYFWGGSQVAMGKRPLIRPVRNDPKMYDLVLIGTPVWAWNFTPVVRTFVEEHPFKGKKVALFASCEGSPGRTFENLREALYGNSFLGEEWFFSPLKKDRDETLRKARAFARSVLKRMPDL